MRPQLWDERVSRKLCAKRFFTGIVQNAFEYGLKVVTCASMLRYTMFVLIRTCCTDVTDVCGFYPAYPVTSITRITGAVVVNGTNPQVCLCELCFF